MSVHFASALRPVAGGRAELEIDGFQGDLQGLLHQLVATVGPSLGDRLLESGTVRRFVNVYVDGQDVRYLGGLAAPIGPSAIVDFIPAVAGG